MRSISDKNAAQMVASVAKWIVLIFFLVMTFVPLVWLVVSSFKSDLELLTDPFGLPAKWLIANYAKAIRVADLHLLFIHSIIVSAGAMALNIVVASMAAYVLSRERFRFRNAITSLILAGVLIPIIGLMVPYFRLIRQLGLYDSLLALILTYAAINIPISVFLLRGFMNTIPKELEEAVIIDGGSFLQRFTRVIFPLSKLGIVTAGTFVFLYSWNEFIYALLLTSSVSARTVQLGIRFFRSQFVTDYTAMYAAIVLTMIPSIAVYVILHERIIKGLTSGAVKG
jgi:raffinose/stachyose/melibiose transport system permease protein